MYFDLNVPITNSTPLPHGQAQSKKAKGKQPQTAVAAPVYNPAQLGVIESRIDLLVHCQIYLPCRLRAFHWTNESNTIVGYTILAFNQTIPKKVDSKTHVNILDGLLTQLKKRPGIVFLKRLTVVLDEDSEKGFGFTNANASLFTSYDILSLVPTTHATFSLACLTHTLPSALTAHIISLPLTLPRLPFHLKHTLIRTALKNGAVFEINYVGALGGEVDPALEDAAESGASAKRNWWAAARELARVTKGKGLVISGGVVAEADLRAPRDVGNLVSLLGMAQDLSHEASTKTPKSIILRAQTRKTYRAVFSEPTVVIPTAAADSSSAIVADAQEDNTSAVETVTTVSAGKKRLREEDVEQSASKEAPTPKNNATNTDGPPKKKKKRKGKS